MKVMMDKRYRYYIFYLKSDKSIYGYTTSKQIRDFFILTRDMSKFKLKTEKLTRNDVNYLTVHYKYGMIINYDFKINTEGDVMTLPITEMEQMNIEHKGYQTALVDIFTHVWIPSDIFDDEIQEFLNNIFYTYCEASMFSKRRTIAHSFEPNLLNIFIQDHLWSIDFSKLKNYRKEVDV